MTKQEKKKTIKAWAGIVEKETKERIIKEIEKLYEYNTMDKDEESMIIKNEVLDIIKGKSNEKEN